MKERIAVIGLGQIGTAVIEALSEHDKKFTIIGVDKQVAAFNNISEETRAKLILTNEMPEADYYLICVWTMDQIMDVVEEIGELAREDGIDPLIIIESTIDMSRSEELSKVISQLGENTQFATVPHRWNPGDTDHGVFNQPRVLGANDPFTLKRVHEFYCNFMAQKDMHLTDFITAATSKVCENAYRFMEIVIAQEMSIAVKDRGIDWVRLREAMNTKWNIDVRDALYGVGGKCLPKDVKIFNRTFRTQSIFGYAEFLNENYKLLVSGSNENSPSV